MSPLFENSENDGPLAGRRSSGEDDTRHTREMSSAQPEREVTLNTGIVLALFFALALLCAVFFGFGYSMGRKSVPPTPVAETDNTPAPEEATNNTPKPSPGSLATTPVPSYVGPAGSPSPDSKSVTVKTVPATVAGTSTVPAEAASHPRPATDAVPGASSEAPVVRVAAATSTAPASSTSATIYVQVSAVSHQEDANTLLSALRRRGYTVFTRSDPNDSLIHVQLGPFATKKDADAMRQRLSGDGYNAILK